MFSLRFGCYALIAGVVGMAPTLVGGQSALPPLNPPPAISAADYAARRAAIAAKVDSGVILAFGETHPLDYYPDFYQMPNFEYLTGFEESDAVMMILKQSGQPQRTLLLVPTQSPIMGRFVGDRIPIADLYAATGMYGRNIDGLQPTLDTLIKKGLPVYFIPAVHSGDYFDEDTVTFGARFISSLRQAYPKAVIRSLDSAITELRERKSPTEIALLRQAAQISVRAHREAMKAVAPSCGENEIQALLDGTFRRLGADRPGYGSIVASGRHANTLHYMIDNDTLRDGDLILIDAAASYRHYSADVTRTFPVNGKFTPAQRDIYQLVRDAQEAYVRQIKNGVSSMIADDSGKAVIGRGLTRMGLIDSTNATFDGLVGMPCPPNGCKQLMLYAPP